MRFNQASLTRGPSASVPGLGLPPEQPSDDGAEELSGSGGRLLGSVGTGRRCYPARAQRMSTPAAPFELTQRADRRFRGGRAHLTGLVTGSSSIGVQGWPLERVGIATLPLPYANPVHLGPELVGSRRVRP